MRNAATGSVTAADIDRVLAAFELKTETGLTVSIAPDLLGVLGNQAQTRGIALEDHVNSLIRLGLSAAGQTTAPASVTRRTVPIPDPIRAVRQELEAMMEEWPQLGS
jgi:hypothetical protein